MEVPGLFIEKEAAAAAKKSDMIGRVRTSHFLLPRVSMVRMAGRPKRKLTAPNEVKQQASVSLQVRHARRLCTCDQETDLTETEAVFHCHLMTNNASAGEQSTGIESQDVDLVQIVSDVPPGTLHGNRHSLPQSCCAKATVELLMRALRSLRSTKRSLVCDK